MEEGEGYNFPMRGVTNSYMLEQEQGSTLKIFSIWNLPN